MEPSKIIEYITKIYTSLKNYFSLYNDNYNENAQAIYSSILYVENLRGNVESFVPEKKLSDGCGVSVQFEPYGPVAGGKFIPIFSEIYFFGAKSKGLQLNEEYRELCNSANVLIEDLKKSYATHWKLIEDGTCEDQKNKSLQDFETLKNESLGAIEKLLNFLKEQEKKYANSADFWANFKLFRNGLVIMGLPIILYIFYRTLKP